MTNSIAVAVTDLRDGDLLIRGDDVLIVDHIRVRRGRVAIHHRSRRGWLVPTPVVVPAVDRTVRIGTGSARFCTDLHDPDPDGQDPADRS